MFTSQGEIVRERRCTEGEGLRVSFEAHLGHGQCTTVPTSSVIAVASLWTKSLARLVVHGAQIPKKRGEK